jgi:hypothetical protein
MRLSILLIALSLSLACDKGSDGDAAPASQSSPTGTSGQPLPSDHNPSPDPPVVNDVHVHLNFGAYKSFLDMSKDLNLVRAANLSGGYGTMPVRAHLALPQAVRNRIAPFMNMNWEGVDQADFGETRAKELRVAVAHGYAGLKISKALGLGVKVEDKLLAVDDPRLDPIFEEAGKLGVPIAIHTADPKAFFEPTGPENERHAELSLAPSWSFYGDEFPSREALLAARDRRVKRHPNTLFILVHFANNPEDLDAVEKVLTEHDNVVVDIAARVGEIGRHDRARVRELFEKYADRILFGTDMQYSLGRRADGMVAYKLTLGSISKDPVRFENVPGFFESHYEFLEGHGDPIDHPIPIQGDWKANPIDLPPEKLHAIYWANSESIVFAPWLGRTMAHDRNRAAKKIANSMK